MGEPGLVVLDLAEHGHHRNEHAGTLEGSEHLCDRRISISVRLQRCEDAGVARAIVVGESWIRDDTFHPAIVTRLDWDP